MDRHTNYMVNKFQHVWEGCTSIVRSMLDKFEGESLHGKGMRLGSGRGHPYGKEGGPKPGTLYGTLLLNRQADRIENTTLPQLCWQAVQMERN